MSRFVATFRTSLSARHLVSEVGSFRPSIYSATWRHHHHLHHRKKSNTHLQDASQAEAHRDLATSEEDRFIAQHKTTELEEENQRFQNEMNQLQMRIAPNIHLRATNAAQQEPGAGRCQGHRPRRRTTAPLRFPAYFTTIKWASHLSTTPSPRALNAHAADRSYGPDFDPNILRRITDSTSASDSYEFKSWSSTRATIKPTPTKVFFSLLRKVFFSSKFQPTTPRPPTKKRRGPKSYFSWWH